MLFNNIWSSKAIQCYERHHPHLSPLWGDKVSMLIHIYSHKPWRKIEVTISAKSPGWQPTLCVVWCLICWFASYKKSMVIHDTTCPYWDQVSLKQHNTKQNHSHLCLQFTCYLDYHVQHVFNKWQLLFHREDAYLYQTNMIYRKPQTSHSSFKLTTCTLSLLPFTQQSLLLSILTNAAADHICLGLSYVTSQ